MVSFRFYLVSVTAVFLALALGIAMGATVVQQATVDALNQQIKSVKSEIRRTDGQNDDLQRRLGTADDFEKDAAPTLVAGRLTGVPVLVVAVRGPDRDIVATRQLLTAAGATVEGTLWLTARLRLDKSDDVSRLAAALGLADGSSPEVVRRLALSRLAAGLVTAEAPSPLTALADLDMVDFEAGQAKDLRSLVDPGLRFVVLSNTEPAVPNDQAAIPFTQELVKDATGRVVAAESGVEEVNKQPGVREAFVGQLRIDGGVSQRVSTVDNLEDVRGRVATVYALDDLLKPTPKLGHYGVGQHRDGSFPQP